MQKINVEQLCASYNKARTENAGRKMPSEKVIEILRSNGVSHTLAIKMVRCDTFFIRYRRENCGRGLHLGYIWPETPIHVNVFKNWAYPTTKKEAPIKSVKKDDKSFEEECAEYLRKQGYKLKKCVGFDEDAFKKAYPQLWEKFLIYEEV